MKEIWKDIEGYEDCYQISNQGRVWSTFLAGRYLKPDIDKDGYHCVKLKGKGFKIHRLVGVAFIPNPENKPQINHKKGNKGDNSAEALEWSTVSENIQHSFDVLGKVPWNKGIATNPTHLVRYGTEHPKHRGMWLTPLGSFDTLRKAGIAHGINHRLVRSRCIGNTKGWEVEDVM